MTESDCKRLTEFLGEKYHDYKIDHVHLSTCSCGLTGCVVVDSCSRQNRTFSTRDDMMDLYAAIFKEGKLTMFMLRTAPDPKMYFSEYIAWLFCLSGEDYEERCEMVRDFIEGGLK